MQLGYLRVTVDPANNTATVWEITVGTLTDGDDNETPQLYNPPVINDTFTFPLRPNATYIPPIPICNVNKTINKRITIGNQDQNAAANGAGSVASNIVIVTPQESRTGSNSATYNINVEGNSDVDDKKVVAKNGQGKIESDTVNLTVGNQHHKQSYQKGHRSERSERSI